ncbi:hypothetical protein SAMN04487948_11949 [Halogranum amylolyticum]|uniref:Uncharacterized protein n=1 Tax=Halogranum amylolyticum TaxID=660520 RepID=A0A1H8VT78_9EURY|nr:hypothetical protein SAMN04487948_11949 [Halogranum amylolyticum]
MDSIEQAVHKPSGYNYSVMTSGYCQNRVGCLPTMKETMGSLFFLAGVSVNPIAL